MNRGVDHSVCYAPPPSPMGYIGNLTNMNMYNRVGPRCQKWFNLHITVDSTGSIYKNARKKKFGPKKVGLGWGDLI